MRLTRELHAQSGIAAAAANRGIRERLRGSSRPANTAPGDSLSNIDVPIVLIDRTFHLQYFTPSAGRLLRLRIGDLGSPVSRLKLGLEMPDLCKRLRAAVRDLASTEADLQGSNGQWYSIQIRPHLREDQQIAGAVISLHNIDQLKRMLQEERRSRDLCYSIVEALPEPLVILDSSLRVVAANRSFYDEFEFDRQRSEGKPLLEFAGIPWNAGAVRAVLRLALSRNQAFSGLEIEGEFPRLGHRIMRLRGRRIDAGDPERKILLVLFNDVTLQKMAERRLLAAQSAIEKNLKSTQSSLRETEADLLRSREDLRALTARLLTTQEEERRRLSRDLHDDINQKLAVLEMDAERLRQSLLSPQADAAVESLRGSVAAVSNEIRRVAYQLHPSILEHLGLAVALRSYCSEFSKREKIRVQFSASEQMEKIPDEVALCLYRVTQEGLRNVARHSAAKQARVTLGIKERRLRLRIRDNGVGFDTNEVRKTGIGLISMKERVRLVNGEFVLKSAHGEGATLDIWAPLPKEPQ
ncbi:MAG TPA: PAS domain-containing protein [Bryobacteraceae bacterium]|jgi:two-component system CheB/CheR fusion protein|nr:PAS domain-containing protein [Bryobacteraceae bacterium]